jgi:hypothetical protein
MGYACPVCEGPQADGEHLANHLAFAAMLHGDAHEAWLDERVPDWADRTPEALATEVVEHAETVEHGTVFDDATGGRPDVGVEHGDAPGHGHGHDHGNAHGGAHPGGRTGSLADLDPEIRRVVEEAVEMTRERQSGGEGAPSDDAEE